MNESDNRTTIDDRLKGLEYATHEIASIAGHIYGVLFGEETAIQAQLSSDPPSIDRTITYIQCHVRDASNILEEIAKRLSDKKRLKIRTDD